jgi:hypothetical protein
MQATDWMLLLIALFTAAAAGGALWAASHSRRAAQASIFSSLMAQYSDEEMLNAMRALAEWRDQAQRGRTGRDLSLDTKVDEWAYDLASASASTSSRILNEHRRRVTHFFLLAARLIRGQHISGDLAAALVELNGKRIWLDVVAPMEEAMHKASHTAGLTSERDLELVRAVFFPSEPVLEPERPN